MTDPTVAAEPCCKKCTRDGRNRYAERARFHANEAAAYYRQNLWALGIVIALALITFALVFSG